MYFTPAEWTFWSSGVGLMNSKNRSTVLIMKPFFSLLYCVGVLPFNRKGEYVRGLHVRFLIFTITVTPILLFQPGFGAFMDPGYGWDMPSMSYTSLLADYMRVLLRLAALIMALLAPARHKDKYKTLWTFGKGINLYRAYRRQLHTILLIYICFLLHWSFINCFLFRCAQLADFNNILLEVQMLYILWLLSSLTLFYCSYLRVLKNKCHFLRTNLKFRRIFNYIKAFSKILDQMSIINELSGFHTLFFIASNFIDMFQAGLLFASYINYVPILDSYELYFIFLHILLLFNVTYMVFLQVSECSSVQNEVRFC